MKALLILLIFIPLFSIAQSSGENLFKLNCSSCHSIGKGKLVGPDLMGVEERRDQDWLKEFIKSPQSMLTHGDSVALSLFQEFNYVPMPDQQLNESQIEQVLQYISSYEEVTSTSSSDFFKESNTSIKKSSGWIEKVLFEPLFWVIAIVLIIVLITLNILVKAIKALTEKLIQSEREKKEISESIKNKNDKHDSNA